MFGPVGKLLIGIGALLIAAGLMFILFNKLGLTRLPGDLVVRRGRFTLFFPVVTCLVISVVLSLIMSIFARLRR
jgi:hypothetical protein